MFIPVFVIPAQAGICVIKKMRFLPFLRMGKLQEETVFLVNADSRLRGNDKKKMTNKCRDERP
jgi:hypothetical protein